MDCLVCNTRSAVDSCVVCHVLLCEICGAKCETCGKVACAEHTYTTHSGKVLCKPCQEKRRAARHARQSGKDHDERGADAEAEAAPEEELERPVLVASARKSPPPWELSLYTACAGVALALIVLLFPGLRRFALPWGGVVPTPYLLILIPVVSIFWGVLGMALKEYREDRYRCLIGIGVALVSCVMMIVAVHTDPARLAEDEAARIESARDTMTPQQLEQWRKERLQKYKR